MTITDLKPPQARPCWHLHDTPQPDTCQTCYLFLNGTDNQKMALAVAAGSMTVREAVLKNRSEGKPLPRIINVRVVKKGSKPPPGERVLGRMEPGEMSRLAEKEESPLPAVPVKACRYVGPELTGYERQAAGLPHNRKWTSCGHPNRRELVVLAKAKGHLDLAKAHLVGGAVCPCKGCGPACPGYSLAGPEDPDPASVD